MSMSLLLIWCMTESFLYRDISNSVSLAPDFGSLDEVNQSTPFSCFGLRFAPNTQHSQYLPYLASNFSRHHLV